MIELNTKKFKRLIGGTEVTEQEKTQNLKH